VQVIDDSYVWKDRLRRERAAFRRKQQRALNDPDRVEEAFVAIEVFAFLTGYITRKLIEAKKLSDELEGAAMRVVTYPATDYKLDFMNAHHVDRGYDFSQPGTETLKLSQLRNMLIHSFVFTPMTDEAGTNCAGFFINTDRTKDAKVILVSLPDFDLLVDEVVHDGIVHMTFDRLAERVTKSRVGRNDPKPRVALNVSPQP
jgi:hypothetical protein